MNHASVEISLVALIPALVLCGYVYLKDRGEKEPIGLLLLLFAAGSLAYIPALTGEGLLIGWFDRLFAEQITHSPEGLTGFASAGLEAAHRLLCAFAGTAFVEETVKWLLLFFITCKSRHFNYLFDGIVYSSFVSLGFAAVENIRYAWLDGWDTLLLRAVTSVPGHLFFGIFMGFCYTVWHTYHLAARAEAQLADTQQIARRYFTRSGGWLAMSYLLPILMHGVYSFTSSYASGTMLIVYYIFIAALYILCFLGVNRISRQDGAAGQIANRWLLRRHPELASLRSQAPADSEVTHDEE